MPVNAQTLERAVLAVCQHLPAGNPFVARRALSERELWYELISCVLSSQVIYETAVGAAKQVLRAGLFDALSNRVSLRAIEALVRQALRGPIAVESRRMRFRFPNAKARQITQTIASFRDLDIPLRGLTYGRASPIEKRKALINAVYGFGPKQASMFIRNTGAGVGLAVLDRHTLRYLATQRLASQIGSPLTLSRYERIEARLQGYASNLGLAIEKLDYAIWIVMRVASSERLI